MEEQRKARGPQRDIQVEIMKKTPLSLHLGRRNLKNGLILSEILGPPLAKRRGKRR